jgi:signal peptidase I
MVKGLLALVRRNAAVEIALIVVLAIGLAVSVQAYAVKPYRIPSESMEPTLQVGDQVIVDRFSHHLGAEPDVGDIVVFHPPTATSETFIKRVVGVSGDRIAVRDGRVVRNGEPQEEPYARPCGDGANCDMPRAVTIPDGHVYVLGDNRGASQDSRFWGSVPVSDVIGEAVAIYWPPGRAGTP